VSNARSGMWGCVMHTKLTGVRLSEFIWALRPTHENESGMVHRAAGPGSAGLQAGVPGKRFWLAGVEGEGDSPGSVLARSSAFCLWRGRDVRADCRPPNPSKPKAGSLGTPAWRPALHFRRSELNAVINRARRDGSHCTDSCFRVKINGN
jgi:hypothetical protein